MAYIAVSIWATKDNGVYKKVEEACIFKCLCTKSSEVSGLGYVAIKIEQYLATQLWAISGVVFNIDATHTNRTFLICILEIFVAC